MHQLTSQCSAVARYLHALNKKTQAFFPCCLTAKITKTISVCQDTVDLHWSGSLWIPDVWRYPIYLHNQLYATRRIRVSNALWDKYLHFGGMSRSLMKLKRKCLAMSLRQKMVEVCNNKNINAPVKCNGSSIILLKCCASGGTDALYKLAGQTKNKTTNWCQPPKVWLIQFWDERLILTFHLH